MTSERSGDRCGRLSAHRRLEVVKPMTTTREAGPRTPEGIVELFAIAGREAEAIRQLSGWVAQLHEVQAAKGELATLTPAEVRAAVEYRRAGVGETQ